MNSPWLLPAFLATCFCVSLPARFAQTIACKSPRLFTILSLYAFSWALLLPLYRGTSSAFEEEWLATFGNFVGVFIGGLLRREAKAEAPDKQEIEVGNLDKTALWLLTGFAATTFFDPERQNHLIALTTWGMQILSFVSILYGLKSLYSYDKGLIKYKYLLILPIMLLYSWVNSSYLSVFYSEGPHMSDDLLIEFSILKIASTLTG